MKSKKQETPVKNRRLDGYDIYIYMFRKSIIKGTFYIKLKKCK